MTNPRDFDGRFGWVGVSRVAALLGVHKRTVARWCARGDIPAERFGTRGVYRVPRAWYDSIVEERKTKTERAISVHEAVQPVRRKTIGT